MKVRILLSPNDYEIHQFYYDLREGYYHHPVIVKSKILLLPGNSDDIEVYFSSLDIDITRCK